MPPQQILQASLHEGFIPHKDDKFLIHGPGGVGKSSLISIFLGKQKDLTRDSTPLAMEPLHLTPSRDISNTRLTGDWERVDYGRLSCMIAHTSNELYMEKSSDRMEAQNEKSGSTRAKGKGEGEGRGINAPQFKGAHLAAVTQHKVDKKSHMSGVASRFFFKA